MVTLQTQYVSFHPFFRLNVYIFAHEIFMAYASLIHGGAREFCVRVPSACVSRPFVCSIREPYVLFVESERAGERKSASSVPHERNATRLRCCCPPPWEVAAAAAPKTYKCGARICASERASELWASRVFPDFNIYVAHQTHTLCEFVCDWHTLNVEEAEQPPLYTVSHCAQKERKTETNCAQRATERERDDPLVGFIMGVYRCWCAKILLCGVRFFVCLNM